MKKQFKLEYQIDLDGIAEEFNTSFTEHDVKSIHTILLNEIPPYIFSQIISFIKKNKIAN